MPQHRFTRHFSIEEADAWLPRLRRLFADIHAALASVSHEVGLIQAQKQRHGGNGGGIDANHYFSHDAAIDAGLDEMQEAGIFIKDLARGLVDFPHLLEGEEVFLCWHLDDPDRIEWYHAIEAGFSGRMRLRR